MKYVALLALGFLFFNGIVSAQQINNANYTVQQANQTLAQASLYIQNVNESGYLIFTPNLTLAYRYLNMGYAIYNVSPNTAVFYAQQAEQAAQQQYGNISYYRSESVPVLFVFTIALAVILIRIMTPVKNRKQRR